MLQEGELLNVFAAVEKNHLRAPRVAAARLGFPPVIEARAAVDNAASAYCYVFDAHSGYKARKAAQRVALPACGQKFRAFVIALYPPGENG